jgi:hypothetical protein
MSSVLENACISEDAGAVVKFGIPAEDLRSDLQASLRDAAACRSTKTK